MNNIDIEFSNGERNEDDGSMFTACTPPSDVDKSKRRKRYDGDLSPSSSAD